MKTILFLFSMIVFLSANAQEKEYDPSSITPSKFSIGFSYSPEITYRFLSSTDNANAIDIDFTNWRNENEEHTYGQSARIFMNYKLTSHFSLEAGLGYTEYGDLRVTVSSPVEGGAPDESTGSVTKWTHQLHTLSVPISLNINIGKKRITGFVSAGLAPCFLLKDVEKRKTTYNNGNVSEHTYSSEWSYEQYNNFFLEAHVSLGLEYRFSRKGKIRIAPGFKLLTTNVYTNEGMQGNYFNAGIEIGAVFKL